MKPRLLCTALAVFAFALVKAQQPQAIPGQFIVVLKESAAKPVVKDQKKNNNREQKAAANKPARDKGLAKAKEVRGKKGINESSVVNEFADVLVGFTAKLNDKQKSDLQSDPDVEAVYQDYVVALGPVTPEANPSDLGMLKNDQDNLFGQKNTGPNARAAIDNTANNITASFAQYTPCAITKAGGSVSGAGKATWIWILDTGIDMDHPDLTIQTSATYAKSFISGQAVEDGHGHGTHCAGIAAARNNTIGSVGVSAGATVVPVKVLSNTGSGAWSSILAGVNHVAMYDIPGDVVSMSLGAYGVTNCENANPALRDAIRNLGNSGTWVVIAAGNDGNCNGGPITLPGCINGNRVYTIGALNCDNTKASYSNGGTNVDFVAVGSGVYSTYKNGSYATLSGTSMATPVVAGVIHARGGAPVNGGNIPFCGTTKPLARR